MRLGVALLLLLFLPGTAVAFWQFFIALFHQKFVPLGIGFGIGLILDWTIDRHFPRAAVFEHELTHAFVSLLFFRRIKNFVVTRNHGGYVVHGGGWGGRLADDLIGFAPYILPTFSVVSVLVRPLMPHDCFPWFDAWIGLTLGYHTLSTAKEIGGAWHKRVFETASGERTRSDIGRRGYLYSLIFIVTMTLVLHGLTFAALTTGYSGIGAWTQTMWTPTKEMIQNLFNAGSAASHSVFLWVREILSKP